MQIKKKLALGILAIAVCLIISCDDKSLGLSSHTVKYMVTGTASTVSITMYNAEGNTEQFSNVPLPWEQSFSVTVKNGGHYFAYISAQNNGSSGTVTSTIYKDEGQFKTSTSSGAHVIATASGSVDY